MQDDAEEFIAGHSQAAEMAASGDEFDTNAAKAPLSRADFVKWLTESRFSPFCYRSLRLQRTVSLQEVMVVAARKRDDPDGSVRIITTTGSMMCGNADISWMPGQKILTVPAHCGLTAQEGSLFAQALERNNAGLSDAHASDKKARLHIDCPSWADCAGIQVIVKQTELGVILSSVQVEGLDWMPTELVAGKGIPDIESIPPKNMKTALKQIVFSRRVTPFEIMPSIMNRAWVNRALIKT